MKKIICILLSMIIMGTASFAQDKSLVKQPKQNPTKQAPIKTTDAKTVKAKKDGTPDMRVKENKQAAKPTQKLKKDGTPDMRYKENKQAVQKK